MTLRVLLVFALVAPGAVVAGQPLATSPSDSAAASAKGPGPARTLATHDIGRTPGRPAPDRGPTSAAGIPRRTSGTTSSRRATLTTRVLPAPGPEPRPNLSFSLAQNTPNPFRVATRIALTAPARAPARLTLYDAQGQKVATLLDRVIDPGQYVVRWEGRDDEGRLLAPGVYLYRLAIGRREGVRKLVFTR